MKYTSTVLSFWEVHTKYTKSILKVYCIPARAPLSTGVTLDILRTSGTIRSLREGIVKYGSQSLAYMVMCKFYTFC